MNQPKYFIFELDLVFNRRGAEGTEEEKKESNLKSPIPNLKLIPVCKKNAIVGKSETMIVIPSQSQISNFKLYDYPLAPVINWKNLGVYLCKRLPAASVIKVEIVTINKYCTMTVIEFGVFDNF